MPPVNGFSRAPLILLMGSALAALALTEWPPEAGHRSANVQPAVPAARVRPPVPPSRLSAPRIAWEQAFAWPAGPLVSRRLDPGPSAAAEFALNVVSASPGGDSAYEVRTHALSTGELLWTQPDTQAFLEHESRFYLSCMGRRAEGTQAVAAESGRRLWSRREIVQYQRHPGSGAPSGRLVLFDGDRASIVDANSGLLVSLIEPLPGWPGSSGLVGTTPRLALFQAGDLVAVAFDTGSVVRQHRLSEGNISTRYAITNGMWSARHGLLFIEDAVYMTGQDNCSNLHALREDLSPAWERVREDQGGIGDFEVVGDTMVAESSHITPDGRENWPDGVIGLDARTGMTRWRRQIARTPEAWRNRQHLIGTYAGEVVTLRWPVEGGSESNLEGIRASDGVLLWSISLPALQAKVYGCILLVLLNDPAGWPNRLRAYWLPSGAGASEPQAPTRSRRRAGPRKAGS